MRRTMRIPAVALGPALVAVAALAGCDAAFVTAGTLLHECCAMGVPAITASVNETQQREAEAIAAQGACWNIGALDQLDTNTLQEACEVLSAKPDFRSQISQAARDLIDRKGRQRVALAILGNLRKKP